MALVVLGGRSRLQDLTEPAWSRADDFFTGFFETALAEGELLTAVRVPRQPGDALGLPEVRAPRQRLGDRRRRGDQRQNRAREHGIHAAARQLLPSTRSLVAPARLRPPSWPPTAPRQVKTSMPTGNSASIWRGC